MHKLLTNDVGAKRLMLGNEAIARGAVEAGLALAATYPGTPSSEISLNLFQISRETDLYFEYSTNEKVALEVAAAAAISGVRSMAIMKHVGVNVAADTLMTLAYVGVKGGMVILTADDPYMFSSQNEQDNRYYAKLSGLPMLEPSSVEEAREMIRDAFDLSERLQEPVIFRTTTRINHSTAVVELGPMAERRTKGDFTRDPFRYVCVPAVSRKLHVRLLGNIALAETLSSESSYNKVEGAGDLGIICNGVSYNYVRDAIADLAAGDRIRVLRIGFSNPMPAERIRSFVRECRKVLVVEEGEPYMEEAVRSIAQTGGVTIPIEGKGPTLFSRLNEFDPATVRRVVASYFKLDYSPAAPIDLRDAPEVPQRPPNLCPGCSHRATYYAVKKAAEGMDVMYPSDIGCYTLGMLPPLSMADICICMGASVGTACGFSKATGKKVVAFIGDSTFLHSGVAGLINAVFNNHDFTLVILDNGITAMTGHQPNPGVDMDELGFQGYGRIDIEQLVNAMGVGHVSVIRPSAIRKSVEQIREALNHKGLSVIIAREACCLQARNLKKLKVRAFQVTDRCKNHRNCINDLGCPAFYLENDRVRINPALCVGCSVCAQICPENAITPVKE